MIHEEYTFLLQPNFSLRKIKYLFRAIFLKIEETLLKRGLVEELLVVPEEKHGTHFSRIFVRNLISHGCVTNATPSCFSIERKLFISTTIEEVFLVRSLPGLNNSHDILSTLVLNLKEEQF